MKEEREGGRKGGRVGQQEEEREEDSEGRRERGKWEVKSGETCM